MSDRMLAALDIGTSSVTCVVAEANELGYSITGVGQAAVEEGLRQGMLVDIQGISSAVEQAMEEAEVLSSWPIEEVIVSVSGTHVKGFAGRGSVSIGPKDDYEAGEITELDVEKAEEAARSVGLPTGCVVLDVIRRDYSVDGFDDLRKPPIGLQASQLSARVYTVIADRIAIHNLEKAVRLSDRKVSKVMPSALASARAVLTGDEMEMGVAVADIGAGTADVAVFRLGSLAHLGVVPLGGSLITSDLQTLRISREQAEKLKTQWAVAFGSLVDVNKSMRVRRLGGRGTFTVSHSVVSQLVTQRVEEIMEAISIEIDRSGLGHDEIPAGLILTGGTSRLPGIVETAREVTGLPVEPGIPSGIEASTELVTTPEFSTAVGLLLRGIEGLSDKSERKRGRFLADMGRKLGGLIDRLR